MVQCNRARAVELFNGIQSVVVNQSVVAVLGAGCSAATEEVARASNGSLPLVSFISCVYEYIGLISG